MSKRPLLLEETEGPQEEPHQSWAEQTEARRAGPAGVGERWLSMGVRMSPLEARVPIDMGLNLVPPVAML